MATKKSTSIWIFLGISVIASLLLGFATSAGAQTYQEAISTANQNFMTTFGKGDAGGIGNLYTQKGQLLPAGNDFVKGKKAIQEFWQGAMNMGIKQVQLETIELEGHGDTAIEVGQYVLSGEKGQVMDKGKYIVIWKQEQSEWKLHRDIWTSSIPPQK